MKFQADWITSYQSCYNINEKALAIKEHYGIKKAMLKTSLDSFNQALCIVQVNNNSNNNNNEHSQQTVIMCVLISR